MPKQKPKPKKIEDFKRISNRTATLLNFCKTIKYGEIFELAPTLEYLGLFEASWRRMARATPELKKYYCYIRGKNTKVVFVHPKYRTALIDSHLAIERYHDEPRQK